MRNTTIRNFIFISFLSILVSRLIPHPPNFTSTIAVAFYIPALFGVKYMIIALSAFIVSDLIIGTHNLLLFTWGALLIISLLSKFFCKYPYRILGISISCVLFYLISNFGVWLLSNMYSKNINGLIDCYFMALPFLQNSLISSLLISIFLEVLITLNLSKNFIKKINSNF